MELREARLQTGSSPCPGNALLWLGLSNPPLRLGKLSSRRGACVCDVRNSGKSSTVRELCTRLYAKAPSGTAVCAALCSRDGLMMRNWVRFISSRELLSSQVAVSGWCIITGRGGTLVELDTYQAFAGSTAQSVGTCAANMTQYSTNLVCERVWSDITLVAKPWTPVLERGAGVQRTTLLPAHAPATIPGALLCF